MGAEGEQIEKLLPRFHAEHPEIRVSVQTIPWSLAHEKLLTAFAGGSNPDVCQLGNTWIPEFQAIDAILPLDSLIAQSHSLSADDFFSGIWETNVVGDEVWGIPWYVDTRVLFYRSDVLQLAGFEQPPQNWSEWIEISRRIRKKAPEKYAVFFPLLFNDFHTAVILIMNNGGRLLKDNDCYGAFDDPATIEAMRYYLTFFEEGLSTRSTTEFPNIYDAFANGDFAMTITGPWNVGQMRRRAPNIAGKWSTSLMPMKENRNSLAGGASLVMFKKSKNQAAAWKFIEFMSSPQTQAEFFRLTQDLPAVREAWEDPQIQLDREIRAFYDQLQHVQPTPKIAEWEQIAVKLQEHLYRTIFGQTTLEQAMVDLNRDVDLILEKRRWLIARGQLLTSE
jgi:multiple sugar transport system substrate-binding protein